MKRPGAACLATARRRADAKQNIGRLELGGAQRVVQHRGVVVQPRGGRVPLGPERDAGARAGERDQRMHRPHRLDVEREARAPGRKLAVGFGGLRRRGSPRTARSRCPAGSRTAPRRSSAARPDRCAASADPAARRPAASVVRASAPSVAASSRSALSCGGVSGVIVGAAGGCALERRAAIGRRRTVRRGATRTRMLRRVARLQLRRDTFREIGRLLGRERRSHRQQLVRRARERVGEMLDARRVRERQRRARRIGTVGRRQATSGGADARCGAVSSAQVFSTWRNTSSAALRSPAGAGACRRRGGGATSAAFPAATRGSNSTPERTNACFTSAGGEILIERHAQRGDLLGGGADRRRHGSASGGALRDLLDIGKQRREAALLRGRGAHRFAERALGRDDLRRAARGGCGARAGARRAAHRATTRRVDPAPAPCPAAPARAR